MNNRLDLGELTVALPNWFSSPSREQEIETEEKLGAASLTFLGPAEHGSQPRAGSPSQRTNTRRQQCRISRR
jgi:hypothetical protein